MNDLLVRWGIEGWKPWLQVLVLPPVSLLLLGLLAWLLVRRRPRSARALGLASLLGLWAISTPWAAHLLVQALTRPPPVLTSGQVAALANAPHTAIVVLGGGRMALAAEYDGPDLALLTVERLRYAVWLARQTQLPLAYSGGVGHGASGGPPEAAVAQLALLRHGGPPLRWAEQRSRDTNENAIETLALLRAEGIRRIVLVTHDFHQQRALAAFRRAAARSGQPLDLVAAPMGVRQAPAGRLADCLPNGSSLQRSTWALHEWLGRVAGA